VKGWSGILVAALCVAADVHAAPATAPAASEVPEPPNKKELADAHAFLQNILDSQGLTPKDKAHIKKLIADLGHDDWPVREKATADLSRFGQEALPLLQAAAKSKDIEVMIRVRRIVEAIEAGAGDPGAEVTAAIDVLAAGRDKRLVGMLIELLGHPSVWARYAAEYGLRRITGQAFGYSAYEDVGRRAAAAEKWRQWWKESKATFSFEKAASQAKQFGLLICDGTGKTVTAVTPAGKVVWTRKLEHLTCGVAGVPNGNVLVGYGLAKEAFEEFDRDFQPVWNADGLGGAAGLMYDVYDIARLPNGNTLIVCLGSKHVAEVTRAGKIAWHKGGLEQPISAQRLANGNTLICEHGRNRVIEVNRAGDIVWQKTALTKPFDAQKLANGNVLIGEGGKRAIPAGKRVIEVNRAGKIVWESKCSHGVAGVCRLPDGTTAIFVYTEGAILVDRSGKNPHGPGRGLQAEAGCPPRALKTSIRPAGG
jgi:uncharacterized protein (UPF0248 family)